MSTTLPLTGRARVFGDDIGTDAILAPARRFETADPARLARHLFESRDLGWSASVQEGDILVAGRNFGCGAVSELAVMAILAAGIQAIVARSISPMCRRTAFNRGLLVVSAATEGIFEGETINLSDVPDGRIELRTSMRRSLCEPLPPFMRSMLEAGGLVPYLRAHGSFGPDLPGERP